MITNCAQVAPGTLGAFDQIAARPAQLDSNGVEETFVGDFETELAQTFREFSAEIVDAFGNGAQALRSMINRIHRGDDSEQDLRRADVTRGFVAPDVLLARLQREPVSRTSVGIMRNADEPARHVPFVLIARREISGVRSAKAERNAETLRGADRNIGPEFARRFQ